MTIAAVFFNIIGLIGAALCLIAFLWLQMGRLKSESLAYSMLNLFGALGILISLFHSFNLGSFVVEAAWLLISLYGLYNRWVRRKPSQ